MATDKVRIKLTAYDHRVLDRAVKEIIEAAKRTGVIIKGPIPLPTKRHWYSIIRSPHKYQYSQEQFEIRVHRRIIDLENIKPQTIQTLQELKLPKGVDVEIKTI